MDKHKEIKKASSQNKEQRRFIHIAHGFQGPIPPPQVLEQYEQIIP